MARIRKIAMDRRLTWLVVALMVFGSIMIVSTDVGQTTSDANIVWRTIAHQCMFCGISLVIMYIFFRYFSFRLFNRLQPLLSVFFLGLMLLPFLFSASGGSHAWIRLGSFSIQPAEFVKPFMVLLAANAINRTKKEKELLRSFNDLFKVPNLMIALFAIELILQKDLGTLSILIMTYLVCVEIPTFPVLKKTQNRIIAALLVLVVLGVGLFFVTDLGTNIIAKTPFSHVATRNENAKNPYNDIYGEGYQPANSLYAIGSSNVIGKGLGESSRKYGYLTQADNDYILAVVLEETGIIGLGLIILMYILLLGRLLYYAFRTNDLAYKVILGGTATYIFMHFFLNVGGVTALMPFTGVPLLFISSGGSSLMSVCMALGICQSCIGYIRVKEMHR